MKNIDSPTWRTAQQALDRAVALHLDDPNVSHIDLGLRILSSEGNRIEPELAVRIHVHQKLADTSFRAFAARQPQRVFDADRIGFAIDVPQATYRLQWWWQPWQTQNQRAEWYRELRGGISISNADSFGFGTLGGKVRDRQSGEEMILSNWHVLAGSWLVKAGLSICQPAIVDGGSETNAIAAYTRDAMNANLDAAVAKLNGRRPLHNEQLEIGAVTGATAPQLGMKVIKSGRRSRVTSGIITGVGGYTKQRYAGVTHIIRDIVHIAPEAPGKEISAPGDSGSWWLERSALRAVGLHFAGSNAPEFGLALSMPEVLESLNVEIAV
ncbi:S1 family peptidase [candidate division KSB1 bacterium]|nr:S1 family peptidase [candidate division KSB1 bacterium]